MNEPGASLPGSIEDAFDARTTLTVIFSILARMIHDGSWRNRGAALRERRAEP